MTPGGAGRGGAAGRGRRLTDAARRAAALMDSVTRTDDAFTPPQAESGLEL